MSPHDDHLPEELRDVEQMLRANREEPSGLELDRIKLRAMRRSSEPAREGLFGAVAARWRGRAVALLLTVGLVLSVSTAGVMANGGFWSPPANHNGKWIIIIIIIKPGHGHGGGGGGHQYCPPNKPGHKGGGNNCPKPPGHGGGGDSDSSSSSSDDSSSRGGHHHGKGGGHDNHDSD